MTPRGIRTNNPGNIRHSAIAWRGKIAGTDPAFETFDSVHNGLRAMARILIGYQTRRGLRTIREMVTLYAPPGENVTSAYVNHVAKFCDDGPDESYDLSVGDRLMDMMIAMVKHENGVQPFTRAQFRDAIEVARAKA